MSLSHDPKLLGAPSGYTFPIQHLDHLRPRVGAADPRALSGTADLRGLCDTALIGSAFDPLPYTLDVRLVFGTRRTPERDAERPMSWFSRQLAGVGQARPNLPNLGLFIWRLKPYRVERATAYSHGDGRFSFSPLGLDMHTMS